MSRTRGPSGARQTHPSTAAETRRNATVSPDPATSVVAYDTPRTKAVSSAPPRGSRSTPTTSDPSAAIDGATPARSPPAAIAKGDQRGGSGSCGAPTGGAGGGGSG